MASDSRRAFSKNAEDIERLIEIHSDLGGDSSGRRYRLEVLNKSSIVLITAIWEAYCEDLATEALDCIVDNVASGTLLPVELKRRIALDIKREQNELAVWDLADEAWKLKVRNRLNTLTEERNRRLNTPKTHNIDDLFLAAIGLRQVSNAWVWRGSTAERARAKLDRYVTLRGAIAHRGAGAKSCTKAQVIDYFEHVKSCVNKTGGKVNSFVRRSVGVGLW